MFDNPDDQDSDQNQAFPITTAVGQQNPAVVTLNMTNDLIEIKRQALSQLAPLLKHLNQTPEEKFRTTMMMIQASDDVTLVKTAYEAALAISDEKTRAQALLDIVNEINYFTQATATEKA